MKTLKTLLLLAGAFALFTACSKKDPKVIDIESHYKNVYMLGGAPGKWDSNDPGIMDATSDPDVFVTEIDLIKNNENKLIKFSLSIADWTATDYLVPTRVEVDKAYCFLKEGENKLQHTSVAKDGDPGLKDWFFGLEKGTSGKYRLEVNPKTLTLKAKKLSSLPDKEEVQWVEGNVYIVGDASPAGWDINAPAPMIRNGDIHTFEGKLTVGEMKFPTKFAWDQPTYMPEENGTVINSGGIANEKVILTPAGDPDNKWKVEQAGKYKLTLDTKAMTLKVQWLGK